MQSASLAHFFPHPPQFCGSVLVVTQALPPVEGHFVVPPGQVNPPPLHLPAAHTVVPPLQTVPHAPQFEKSALRFTHTPEHFVMPGRHTQVPLPSQ